MEVISPKIMGNIHFYQKSVGHVKKVAMFVFNNVILLRGLRLYSLMENDKGDVEVL